MPPPGRRAPDTPYTDAEREAVRSRHAAGMGRNAIARETKIHQRKVSAIAAELGLTFVRAPHVQAAVEAKVVDAKGRRAQLALDLLDDIEEIRQQLRGRSKIMAYAVGGKDNELTYGEVPRPSPRDLRDLATAINVLTGRSLDLDRYDADPGIDAAKSMLGALAAGLGAAYDQLNKPTDGD